MSETPSEIDILRAALAAAEARAAAVEEELVAATGELTQVQAVVSAAEEMIRHLRLQIVKPRREQYGHSAERHARLIEQLEMQLEDLETDLGQDRTPSSMMQMACRCPGTIARHAGVAPAGPSPLELESTAHGSGGLSMQLNKVHSVKTVDRVAAELGETIDRLHDLAIGMDPEDGVIWVYGTAEIEMLAFTPFGIENLVEMIAMERRRQP
jgi:hypothetical protein